MGPVCNHQLFPNTVEEDKIVIRLRYRARDHVDLNNGTQNFVSAGAMYSQEYLTVAQISTWSLRNYVYEPPTVSMMHLKPRRHIFAKITIATMQFILSILFSKED